MALLFMDGFSTNDAPSKWDFNSNPNGYTVTNASPRISGGWYVSCGGLGCDYHKTITASSQVFVGYGIYVTNTSSYYLSFYGDSGATQHITVVRNASTGVLEIRRGNTAGTLLASGTTVIPYNQWNYIEVSATIADAGGQVRVRMNGLATDEVSYTGDTKNGGTATTIDKVYLNIGTQSRLTDVYILNDTGTTNNTFRGDVTIRTLSPAGNGTYSQLTGSDGNQTDNYLLVDEHPYSSTDYVGSSTVGQKDTYTMADLPGGVGAVYALQISGMMAKSDAALAQARYVLRSGGTDFGGATRTLTTTPTGYYQLYEQDPATSVQWTPAGVNAAESGMEVM